MSGAIIFGSKHKPTDTFQFSRACQNMFRVFVGLCFCFFWYVLIAYVTMQCPMATLWQHYGNAMATLWQRYGCIPNVTIVSSRVFEEDAFRIRLLKIPGPKMEVLKCYWNRDVSSLFFKDTDNGIASNSLCQEAFPYTWQGLTVWIRES